MKNFKEMSDLELIKEHRETSYLIAFQANDFLNNYEAENENWEKLEEIEKELERRLKK